MTVHFCTLWSVKQASEVPFLYTSVLHHIYVCKDDIYTFLSSTLENHRSAGAKFFSPSSLNFPISGLDHFMD
jgi:hypothetical protein